MRIRARGQHVVAEHRFDELAVAHTAENRVRVNARDPPDDERVRFVAIELVAKESDAEELIDVLGPKGEADGFASRDLVEQENEMG